MRLNIFSFEKKKTHKRGFTVEIFFTGYMPVPDKTTYAKEGED